MTFFVLHHREYYSLTNEVRQEASQRLTEDLKAKNAEINGLRCQNEEMVIFDVHSFIISFLGAQNEFRMI